MTSMVGAIAFLLLGARSRAYIGVIALIIVAMISGVGWFGGAAIVEHFGQAVDQFVQMGTPDVGRAMIWRGAANMIGGHPIVGVGLGAFVTIYPTYESAPSPVFINYAHNDYLQILAEGGAIAGVIASWFLVIVVLGIRRGMQSTDQLVASVSLAAGAGIIALVIQSVVDTDLQIPSNALLFLILVAVVSRPAEPAAVLL